MLLQTPRSPSPTLLANPASTSISLVAAAKSATSWKPCAVGSPSLILTTTAGWTSTLSTAPRWKIYVPANAIPASSTAISMTARSSTSPRNRGSLIADGGLAPPSATTTTMDGKTFTSPTSMEASFTATIATAHSPMSLPRQASTTWAVGAQVPPSETMTTTAIWIYTSPTMSI